MPAYRRRPRNRPSGSLKATVRGSSPGGHQPSSGPAAGIGRRLPAGLKSRRVAGVISSATTPTVRARNSTAVTRLIGGGPHPDARERHNAPIQSTSPASAATQAASRPPRPPTGPPPAGAPAPRPSWPARRRRSWSGPGDGRRARPGGCPGAAAAAPPGPGARRSARRPGRRLGRSRRSQGASRRSASDLHADDGAHGRPRDHCCRSAPADRAGQPDWEGRLLHAKQLGPQPSPSQAGRLRSLQVGERPVSGRPRLAAPLTTALEAPRIAAA
jgi:hypothetical protein